MAYHILHYDLLEIDWSFNIFLLKGSKNPLPLDIGSVNYKQARRILLFSLDDYSLEEWTEAVNYISQTRQKFETKEATRDFLYVLILTKAKLYDL